MRVLFCTSGSAKRGSWIIRGEQLGASIGADIAIDPPLAVITKADAVVVVKRASADLLSAIRRSGKPLIFDVVDCWAQPGQSQMSPSESRAWLRSHIASVGPAAIVCTTMQMKTDAAFDGPSVVLPHHGWRRHVNQLRDKVEIVGYEGCADYLQEWRKRIEAECSQRGWKFLINPKGGIGSVDIAVAFRGGKYDGYPSRNWKSNVKVANAQITGTPIVTMREAGAVEFCTGGEVFADTPAELTAAFDLLTSKFQRTQAAKTMLPWAQRIEAIAPGYKRWIESVCA